MFNALFLLIFVGGFCALVVNGGSDGSSSSNSFEVVFGWKELDFKWPTPRTRQRLLQTKQFIPENNILTGIKLWKERVFLSVPRQRDGVPSTLNVLQLSEASVTPAPQLVPYPSWKMQQIGNCSAFQYVHSMEIDEFGRMWIIDIGRVFSSDPENACPPKLIIMDLEKDEIVKKYEFPRDVVSRTNNYLNDLVVDCIGGKEKCWLYITDPNGVRLVMYNLEEDRSWFVQHPTMLADPMATNIPILGHNYTFNVNIDGIALSPRDSFHDRIYYTPISSFSTFSVPASILKGAANGVVLRDSDVTVHTTSRLSQSSGMMMDSQGTLFYVRLQNNSVVYVDTTKSNDFKETWLMGDDVDLQWPNSFGFDKKGYLYMTTNRQQLYVTNRLNLNDVNFRVVRAFIGTKSYMYCTKENGRRQLPKLSRVSGYSHGRRTKLL